MSLITRMLKQKAIYWPVDGKDSYGQPTNGGPVAIKCRWEDVQEEFITPKGTTEMSKAVVYVDRDMEAGGLLLIAPGFDGASGGPLGPTGNMMSVATAGMFISFVSTPTDPDMDEFDVDNPKKTLDAWEIRAFGSFPNLKATEFLRRAWL